MCMYMVQLRHCSCCGVQEGAEQLVGYGAQRTIRSNLPVIVFESRTDKRVSPDMLAALPAAPEAVLRFDLLTFCQGLGYSLMAAPVGVDMNGNWILLPPG